MQYRQLNSDQFEALRARILYEDNHILVVNKLCGEITQGDKTGDECLAETYKAFIARRDNKPGKVFMGIPHRLDRPVSGILILAKTSKALERLAAMFRDGDVHKCYWALCCAAPGQEEALLEDWLVRNERLNKSFIAKEGTPGAKLARLKYRHIADTDRYHLLEVEQIGRASCRERAGGGAAHRSPPPDTLSAFVHRMRDKGRSQIRSAPLKSGRRHQPALTQGEL